MNRRLEVENATDEDVKRWMREAVASMLHPLQEEMRELRDELRRSRRVITHKEAPSFFNGDVTAETILRYIHEEGLPARKTGRLYFIRLDDLFAWQMGEIGACKPEER